MSGAGEETESSIAESSSAWSGQSEASFSGSKSNDSGSKSTDSGSRSAEGKHTAGKNKETRSKLRRLLSYRWIMKNMFFFLFLAALAVIYIYNGHYADKIVRDINRTNKELKELQYEYKTLKSEVMFRSKQSELAKAVSSFGLKELTAPPVVLVDSSR